MNQEFDFETIPFEIDSEFQDEMFEEESESGRRLFARGGKSFRPPSRPRLPPKGVKRPPVRPQVIPRGYRRPWEVIRAPYDLMSDPYSDKPESLDSERVRWIQDCLNRIMGLQLPVTGIMGVETRSAIRNFQKQQGLQVTGIVGPDTEQALIAATETTPASKMEEFDLFDIELADMAWTEEINRKSSDYIKWVQQSLNNILGLKLAVDGESGKQTRSAIRSFQQQVGLEPDGIMGEKTEAAMITRGASTPPQSKASDSDSGVKMRKHKNGGYSAYGGGSVTAALKKLKNQGLLNISDGDIEMLQRMANVETDGLIQGINSWDSAYMSMGFMQWPVLYDNKHGGKLQRLIQMVPEAFKHYGIELTNEKYVIRSGGEEYTSWKIKGAPTPADLRSEIWAKRFYLAGLDTEIIAAEVKLALIMVREALQKMLVFADNDQLFDRIRTAYDSSPKLRALIQEAFNHRPAYAKKALKNAMLAAKTGIGAEEFIKILQQKIREAYPQNADSQKSAENIINKTAKNATSIDNEFEPNPKNFYGFDDNEYEINERGEEGFFGKYLDPLRFSSVCDRTAATPSFLISKRKSLTPLLSSSQNASAIQKNRTLHPAKSGVQPADIITDLKRYVDFDAVREAIQRQSGGSVVLSEGTVDAVFVEAVHQFQTKVYFDKTAHDGVVGSSTFSSLGIIKHNLRQKIDRGVFGQKVLNNISDSTLTNGEFNAKNWYDFIVTPSFLGHSANNIHLLLVRKLREAENYLLSLPAYNGMTSVELGRALNLDRSTVNYSGGRISNEKQSMHGLGLALDIDPFGNPWIGAGWIKNDKKKIIERYEFLETLKSAAQKSSNDTLNGSNIFEFLHGLAVSYGKDTNAVYKILSRRNDEFKTYLKSNPSILRFWKNSATFDNRDPLNGFLNLHPDLILALRQKALLAWGATDFGPRASGDVMHFDLRTLGVGKVIAKELKAYVPNSGHHPVG